LENTDAEIIEVSERALAAASSTDTPQNLVALLRPRAWSWSELTKPSPLVVILDRMQDPGNVGTIVRSAEAFGATGVVFLKGCARVANGKVLRASAGSIFRIPFVEEMSGSDLIENLQSSGLRLYALTAQAATPAVRADLRSACALLVGSEGSGISPDLLASAEGLSIPTARVESLNAAVACSIALYEARQQRRAT
jgi:TrmH family RNA methyltransferase